MWKITIVFFLLASCLLADEQIIDFKLEDIDGKYQKLSELQQEGLVILDFWATWCDPCKKALPKLNEIHGKFDDVTVITINIDKPRKKAEAISHIKSNRFQFISLFDPSSNVAKQFNVTSIPRSFILEPGGNIIYDHTGYQRGDEKEFEKIITEWLEKKQSIEEIE